MNMKSLNKCVEYQHFKMERICVLKDTIRPLDFFAKIHLKDAYLTVPIKEQETFCKSGGEGFYTSLPVFVLDSLRCHGRSLCF